MPKRRVVSETIQYTLQSDKLLAKLLTLDRFPTIDEFKVAWTSVGIKVPKLPLKMQEEVDEFCDVLHNGVMTMTAATLLDYHNGLKANVFRRAGGTPPQEWTP